MESVKITDQKAVIQEEINKI